MCIYLDYARIFQNWILFQHVFSASKSLSLRSRNCPAHGAPPIVAPTCGKPIENHRFARIYDEMMGLTRLNLIHINMYTYIHTLHTYIRTYIRTYILHTYIHTYYTRIHYIYIYITYIYIYIYIYYIYIYIFHIYIYIYICWYQIPNISPLQRDQFQEPPKHEISWNFNLTALNDHRVLVESPPLSANPASHVGWKQMAIHQDLPWRWRGWFAKKCPSEWLDLEILAQGFRLFQRLVVGP